MNNIYLFVLFSLLPCLLFAQSKEVINAPLNPKGSFQYKKEHFSLRGDVYSYGGSIFDRKGNLVYKGQVRYQYDDRNRVTWCSHDYKFKYNSRGNVVEVQDLFGRIYKFRDDLMISEETSKGDKKEHSYHSDTRRVYLTRILKNDKEDKRLSYSYDQRGDTLKVAVKHTSYLLGYLYTDVFYFIDGHLVKKIVCERDPYQKRIIKDTDYYRTIKDKKGNATLSYNTYGGDKKDAYQPHIRYYSDADEDMKLEYGYYSASWQEGIMPRVFVNGQLAIDIVITEGTRPNEKIIYDGLTQTYYTIRDTISNPKNTDIRIPVTEVLSAGAPYISYEYNGENFFNYINGTKESKSHHVTALGPHMIYYRESRTYGRTFMIKDYKKRTRKPVMEMELLSTDTANLFYLRDSGGDNFFVVNKGQHIDYEKTEIKNLSTGATLLFVDEKPTYVLKDFEDAVEDQVQVGKYHQSEWQWEQENAF
ncbi:MAG: hypothetical protein AAF573_01130 [Bacteroidota bacterium]